MDTLTPAQRSERMSRVKGKGSAAERHVRSLVHRLGYRFRLHGAKLPGKPDLVFASRRKVIFVHGCFWHRHPDPNCSLARLPKLRQDFWVPKLEGNWERDLRIEGELESLGWKSLAIWECQIRDTAFLEDDQNLLGITRSIELFAGAGGAFAAAHSASGVPPVPARPAPALP